MQYYKFFYHVPESHLEATKKAIFDAGAGKMGNYSCCSWEVKGLGQFCPEAGSNPYLGKLGKIEKVIEYKVETICSAECIGQVITALKTAHPYEHPAYGIIKIEF